MASVLLFNISSPEKLNLFQVLSIRLNYALRIIPPDHQGCRIRDLLEQRDYSSPVLRPFHDEMLIMNGFSHQDLNFLLNELIHTGHPVRLKAVVTPTNQSWTAAALHAQLLAEDSINHRSC